MGEVWWRAWKCGGEEGEKAGRGADGDVGVPRGADDGRFFSHGGTESTGGEGRGFCWWRFTVAVVAL
jgi:hypothetical protein